MTYWDVKYWDVVIDGDASDFPTRSDVKLISLRPGLGRCTGVLRADVGTMEWFRQAYPRIMQVAPATDGPYADTEVRTG